MKKISIVLVLILIFSYNLFASVNPNILINGYLGENLPPSLILKVDSTIIEDNGSIVSITGDYNFSDNRSSFLQPVNVYIGYDGSQNNSNAYFTLTVSTQGFRRKDTSGNLIGNSLDVDIEMYTESILAGTSTILVNSSSLLEYDKSIYLDLVSYPAIFTYSVNSGAIIDDANYIIYFSWSEKNNVPAGNYGSIINFAITAS